MFLLLAFSLSTVKALSDSDYQIRKFESFNVYLDSSSFLIGLDSEDYNYVALEPLNSTVINGTNCNLWAARLYGGQFSFLAQDNATVLIHETIGGVRWNGAIVGEGITAQILEGETYTLEWSYTMTPLLPLTFMLGIMGVAMALGGPFYTINKWRDNHDLNGCVAGTVITLIGFAFIIGWLFI